ncbi:MAG: serine hydrolase [Nocardioides sp.]
MTATPPSPSPELETAVEARVRQLLATASRPDEATVSVWAGDLEGRALLARDADAVHYAASTMKLPLVVAAYRLHGRGVLDLDAQVPVHNSFASAADGSPFSLDQAEDQDDETWDRIGDVCTLRVLAEHALVKSGNLATDLVLEHVGAAEVAAVLADAGCSSRTRIPRGIEDLAAARAGLNNLVTAADLGRVLVGVAARSLASASACAEIEEVLTRQEHRSGIPAGLPPQTYVANKTGWVEGITHDMALVRPEDSPPFVLVVLTTVDVPEPDGQALIADLSRIVWEGTQP